MQEILTTQHLRLREFNTGDGEFILQLLNTPGWIEFIGNRNIHSVEEAKIYLLTGPLSSYQKQGFGLYMVELKESRTPVGMCGLIKRDTLEHVDIGFAFLPEYSGKGYAFEAATATMDFAKNTLKMEKVISITNTDNVKSINLLKKLGFVYEKNIRLPYEDKDLFLFSTTA